MSLQRFLTWQTDPLLLDPSPLVQNSWLTANELLTQGARERIFSPRGQFQLYSFMLRKVDFFTGERLLQSFPYLLLDSEWCLRLRKETLSLAEKAHYYFQGTNAAYSIRNWQQRLTQYLDMQQRLPFPLFRLAANWEDFFTDKQFIVFQSARGERFQLPMYLSEEIAYLTGVIMGDGHLAEYFINIIDTSKEHIENLATLLTNQFNSTVEIFKQGNANAWNVNILGKWLVRFINFLSGQPINKRKYPALQEPLIYSLSNFNNSLLFRCAFWRGLMDADAGYRRDVIFTTASKQLVDDFLNFLNEKQIVFYFSKKEGKDLSYSVRILGSSRRIFLREIGSSHPIKLNELIQTVLCTQSERILARKEQENWAGRITSFNEAMLTTLGYFALPMISNLSVLNAGTLLRILRDHSKTKIAHQLSISSSLLSDYENNKRATPIVLLQRLINLKELPLDLMSLLEEYQLSKFSVHKAYAQLALKPSPELLDLLQGLQIKKGYFFTIGLPNLSLKDYRHLLATQFQISYQTTNKKRFNNKVLYSFVETFCTFD